MLNLRILKLCHRAISIKSGSLNSLRAISNATLLKSLDVNTEKLLKKYENTNLQYLIEEKSKILETIKELDAEVKSSDAKSKEDKELKGLIELEKEELQGKAKEISVNILEQIFEIEQESDSTIKVSRNTKALFEITAGVGGKEAMLFTNELFELYYKYFAFKGWQIVDLDSDQQGNFMRHVRMTLEGLDVWNHMRFEAGVHRVQRVPETESKGRMHTSTATGENFKRIK